MDVNRSTAADWLGLVRAGDTITWGQADAEPRVLTRALLAHRHRLGQARLFLGIGRESELRADHADVFEFLSYCGSGSNRILAEAGVLDVLPCHYGEFPELIRRGRLRIDVVLLQLPPPGADGRYSLGLAAEYLMPAIDSARVVIAEINERLPFVQSERYLMAERIHVVARSSYPVGAEPERQGELERCIAANAADWIEDGATLQCGLGAVPNAILAALRTRRDLGIHSGALTDAVVELHNAGAVTNARKGRDHGVSVAGLLLGSDRLHRFAHDNHALRLCGTAYTHDPQVLQSLPRFTAINSAIEVDLTGQVNAEVANGVYVGAVGGALDFLRAAHRSVSGLPIIALSATARGRSRIVAQLSGPVSTPRSDAGVIVTEHGSADLRGRSLAERIRLMVGLADPQHREALEAYAHGAMRKSGVLHQL